MEEDTAAKGRKSLSLSSEHVGHPHARHRNVSPNGFAKGEGRRRGDEHGDLEASNVFKSMKQGATCPKPFCTPCATQHRSFDARCPQPSRQVRWASARFNTSGFRLQHLWKLGHLQRRNGTESGSLALRLTSSSSKASAYRLPRHAAWSTTVVNEQFPR